MRQRVGSRQSLDQEALAKEGCLLAWLDYGNHPRRSGQTIVAYLRGHPGAEVLYTSCAHGPGSPLGFYLRCGFSETGRVMDGEHVLALHIGG